MLIGVHAAGVNPVDRAIRQGYFKERMPFKLPFVPGWDVAGVVEAVGSAFEVEAGRRGLRAHRSFAGRLVRGIHGGARIGNRAETEIGPIS